MSSCSVNSINLPSCSGQKKSKLQLWDLPLSHHPHPMVCQVSSNLLIHLYPCILFQFYFLQLYCQNFSHDIIPYMHKCKSLLGGFFHALSPFQPTLPSDSLKKYIRLWCSPFYSSRRLSTKLKTKLELLNTPTKLCMIWLPPRFPILLPAHSTPTKLVSCQLFKCIKIFPN